MPCVVDSTAVFAVVAFPSRWSQVVGGGCRGLLAIQPYHTHPQELHFKLAATCESDLEYAVSSLESIARPPRLIKPLDGAHPDRRLHCLLLHVWLRHSNVRPGRHHPLRVHPIQVVNHLTLAWLQGLQEEEEGGAEGGEEEEPGGGDQPCQSTRAAGGGVLPAPPLPPQEEQSEERNPLCPEVQGATYQDPTKGDIKDLTGREKSQEEKKKD